MSGLLLDTVERHKSGEAVGVYSICSSHPLVIEASMLQVLGEDSYLLVEATSNQVDQFGGYTGMKPRDFRRLVLGLAERRGLPEDRVVLGGDRLGPNRWRGLPAEEAMGRAGELVALYVASGFTKIHLDCSKACADDTGSTRCARWPRGHHQAALGVRIGRRCSSRDHRPIRGGSLRVKYPGKGEPKR